MSNIRIQAGGQSHVFDGSRPVRLGRDASADVTLDSGTVSRQHAELRPTPQGWEIVDVGSSHGTWINGQRVQQAPITGQQTLLLGHPQDGAPVLVVVESDRPAPPPGMNPAMQPGHLPPTIVPNAGGAPGPYGAPQAPGILVRSRGGDRRFPAHAPVRIGREPGLEIVPDDQAVSRQHALLEPRPDGWWFVDRSTSGSYVDGERVSQVQIEEPMTVLLGHPTAGYELELVPVVSAQAATKAIQGKKRRRSLGKVGMAIAAVLLLGGVVGGVVALTGGDDDKGSDSGLTEAELDRAKAASVFLIAVDASGEPFMTGSGSVISEDGLIITNAHVARPNAPGAGASEFPDPDYLLVALTQEADDKPAEPTYRAVPIVSDGYLDLSVLQIVADADGNEVAKDELDLPEPMPIGSSADMRTGDEITALGYPGIGNPRAGAQRPLTVTRGVVSTFQRDEVVETERGYIDSDVRLGSGNSGGASINEDGELVAINTAVITAVSEAAGAITQGSALLRPIDLAEEVLRIAREGGDPDYVTPYAEDAPDPVDPPSDVSAKGAGWTYDGEGGCAGDSSTTATELPAAPGDTVYAEFVVTGLPEGAPLAITFYPMGGDTPLGSVQDTWRATQEPTCVKVPFTITEGVTGVVASFVVGENSIGDSGVVFQ